jgi:hypothetical protein
LFHQLYTVFVQAPYRGTVGGTARLYFQGPATRRVGELASFEESLRIGTITADPPIRFGGLLFAGALMEIIPMAMISATVRYCCPDRAYWSLKSEQVYGLYFPSVDRKGFLSLHRYLGQFERKKWGRLDQFLTQQELRYRRDGVYNGIPFSHPLG